jgi:hypothetical protein
MNTLESILAWIHDLPGPTHPLLEASRKRELAAPASEVQQHASPPASAEDDADN